MFSLSGPTARYGDANVFPRDRLSRFHPDDPRTFPKLRQIGAAIGSQKLNSSSTLKGPNCHSPDRLVAGPLASTASSPGQFFLGCRSPGRPDRRPQGHYRHRAMPPSPCDVEVGRLQLPVNVDIMHRAENLLPDDLDQGNDRPADLGWIVLFRQVQSKFCAVCWERTP